MLSKVIYRLDTATDTPEVFNTLEVENIGGLVRIGMDEEEVVITSSQASELSAHLRYLSERIEAHKRGY